MEKLEATIYINNRDFDGNLKETLQEYYDIEFVDKLGNRAHKIMFPPAATEGILMQPGVIYLEFYNPAYERDVLLHGWSSRQIYYGVLKTDGNFNAQEFREKVPKLNMSKDGDNTYKVNFPAITKELMLKQPGVVSLTYQHGGTPIKELGETGDSATALMMKDLGLSEWGVSLPKVLRQSKSGPPDGDIAIVATDPDRPVTMRDGVVMQLPTSPQEAVEVQAPVRNDFSTGPTETVSAPSQPRSQPTTQPAPPAPAPREEDMPPISDRGTAPPQKKPALKDDDSSSTMNAGLKWGFGLLLSAWLGNKLLSNKKKK